MRFFPRIRIVDGMPHTFTKYLCERQDRKLTGTFNLRTKELFVLRNKKRMKMLGTLFHELGHWLINVIAGNSWLHDWYDKKFLEK